LNRNHRSTLFALALVLHAGAVAPASAQRLDGLNVIATPGHPFGSISAERSLAAAKRLGAGAVALVPFLWQASPHDSNIARGKDMPDSELRAGRRARSDCRSS
jgi:hypothetical protein